MALDHMQIAYEIFDSCDIRKYPVWNPRAEIPILDDDGVIVRNSSTILDYLHRRFPSAPSLMPDEPRAFAKAKEWEIIADTMVDPIVTNCGIFAWAELPPQPDGLIEAGRRDMAAIYDQLEHALGEEDYVAGDLSIADIALYPQIHGAQHVGLAVSPQTHPRVSQWFHRLQQSPIGKADKSEVVKWWKTREQQDVETDKINWGAYRLEWFLANGFTDWFYTEIERGAVLWSVGPDNNAKNSPHFAAG